MSRIKWVETLHWTPEILDELRHTGYAYIRQGKYDIALSFFEALVALNPQDAYDAQTLGALYVEINRPHEAIRYLDRSLQLETDHSPTLLNLCKAFFMAGKVLDGLRLAKILAKDSNASISSMATALCMAYSHN